MAYYLNTNSASDVAAVEFIPRPEGNFTFFYARTSNEKALKATLHELGQIVLSEAKLDGKTILVSKGEKTQEELIKAFAEHGDEFVLPPPKREFHPWKWRGHFSNVGQGLTLISSYAGKKLDGPKLGFAGLNLTANMVNTVYGAQKEEDQYHLRLLKQQINDSLRPHLPAGAQLPDVEDSRFDLRKEPEQRKTMGQRFNQFMRENSVRVGEIGLRYLGSIAMVLSIDQFITMGQVRNGAKVLEKFKWGRAWETMRAKSPKTAFGLLNTNKTNLWTGITYLSGKTLGLIFARTPDPFNPEPKTAFDNFREKYAFRMSSVIETGAAATLAIGSFRKRDWIGGLGGTSLVGGLLTRLFAPFGVRQVHMNELYSHAVDGLAVMPPDKLPQLLATTAAGIKEAFKENPETFGQIFTILKDKLYHEHAIAINADLSTKSPAAVTERQSTAKKIPLPMPTHVEQIKQSPASALGIS